MNGVGHEVRTPALEEAYVECREIAKREAKNFYWAFRVLPPHKSDAMCAVYAFMRKADDLADDERLTIDQRRVAMAKWTAEWHASRGKATQDPVFRALNDTQRRFGISDELLEKLVEGTTLDLQENQPGIEQVRSIRITEGGHSTNSFQVYRTFEELYRYCYLVASVVGLVCIRIFGYSDVRAEALAEETGVAFQLTNILRDVKEEFGESLKDLQQLAKGRTMTERERGMLATLAIRAEKYYIAGRKLIP